MGDPGQKAVVLVSGGLDSCVTAAIARLRHQKILFLHVNYGQRTEAREMRQREREVEQRRLAEAREETAAEAKAAEAQRIEEEAAALEAEEAALAAAEAQVRPFD